MTPKNAPVNKDRAFELFVTGGYMAKMILIHKLQISKRHKKQKKK
jgi:hypothetical protein